MNTKKIVAILLTCTLLILTVNVFAVSTAFRYEAILDFRSNLSISSSGTANCYAALRPSAGSESASVVATLKKSTDGRNWSNVASWSSSGTMPSSASISETVSVSRGYQYKLFVTGI